MFKALDFLKYIKTGHGYVRATSVDVPVGVRGNFLYLQTLEEPLMFIPESQLFFVVRFFAV